MNPVRSAHLKLVAAAAARLAIVYAVGVLILYAPMRLWLLPHAGGIHELPGLSLQMAILAAVAFAVLAVARRVGFLLLWALLLMLWVSNVSEPLLWKYPGTVLSQFISWSVLAIPLYAIAAFGGSDRVALRIGNWRVRVTELGALVWTVLIIGSFLYVFLVEGAFYDPGGMALSLVWLPAPFILAIIALIAIWVRPRDEVARAA